LVFSVGISKAETHRCKAKESPCLYNSSTGCRMELNFAAREIKTWRIVRFSEFLNKPTEQLRTEANEQHPHQNTDGKSVHVR